MAHRDEQLHRDLEMKRLNPAWAKAEIFLGLTAATLGLVALLRPPVVIEDMGIGGFLGGMVLVVLGGYLAMAGHRSHLYMSNNRLVSWLATKLGR